MINDLKIGFKVLKYGLSYKSSMIGIILFMIIGAVVEVIQPNMPIGGVYMGIGGVFTAQMIHSVCLSTMVHTSPNKKKMQTSIPTCVTFAIFMVSNTLMLVVRFWSSYMQGKSEAELCNGILFSAVLMMVVCLYTAGAFKAFVPATIIFLIAFMVVYSTFTAFTFLGDGEAAKAIVPLWASVILSYIVICAGCVIMYLIYTALYKKEYSKLTFQAALNRAK